MFFQSNLVEIFNELVSLSSVRICHALLRTQISNESNFSYGKARCVRSVTCAAAEHIAFLRRSNCKPNQSFENLYFQKKQAQKIQSEQH